MGGVASPQLSFYVSPPLLEIDQVGGGVKNFTVEISNTGQEKILVKTSYSDILLSSDGKVELIRPLGTTPPVSYTHLGVETVWLCISDAHTGLKNAIQKCFLGSSWQRCKVHFMRNILVHIPHKEKESFAAKLKQIWYQPDQELSLIHI